MKGIAVFNGNRHDNYVLRRFTEITVPLAVFAPNSSLKSALSHHPNGNEKHSLLSAQTSPNYRLIAAFPHQIPSINTSSEPAAILHPSLNLIIFRSRHVSPQLAKQASATLLIGFIRCGKPTKRRSGGACRANYDPPSSKRLRLKASSLWPSRLYTAPPLNPASPHRHALRARHVKMLIT